MIVPAIKKKTIAPMINGTIWANSKLFKSEGLYLVSISQNDSEDATIESFTDRSTELPPLVKLPCRVDVTLMG